MGSGQRQDTSIAYCMTGDYMAPQRRQTDSAMIESPGHILPEYYRRIYMPRCIPRCLSQIPYSRNIASPFSFNQIAPIYLRFIYIFYRMQAFIMQIPTFIVIQPLYNIQ